VALAGIDGLDEDIRVGGDRVQTSASITLSRLHILALDTTTPGGSAAVMRDATLLNEWCGDAALTHGERLPGDFLRALEGAGIGFGDLDLLAVAAGPGSFTGLRVGIAAMQGLAVARGLRVVPVPTLEALAAAARQMTTEPLIAAWMDGQRGQVFAALYERDGREVAPPLAAIPADVLGQWNLPDSATLAVIGDGATRYETVLREHLGSRVRILPPPPLASTIARIAFEQRHRAVSPDAIVPIYVRRPDAELARQRRQSTGEP
jgi:tRNA threonylcarbamoyladenosine biosynthesis protein TsaB